MTSIIRTLYILSACLIGLSGCGHEIDIQPMTETPPAQRVINPTDAQLKTSLSVYMRNMKAPAYSTYEFKRFDLNNDKRRDALVLIKTPYGFWCGTHGCAVLVMEAHNDHFTPVTLIRPVRPPVHVFTTMTNGWKDLAFRVSGRQHDAKNVLLQFDGKTYPRNPDFVDPYHGALFSGQSVMLFP
jgi:hypothetical protein